MIPIQNVYYMLSYAFQALSEQGYKSVATEHFHNVTELCAAILIKGVSSQLKRGLTREYIGRTEALSSLRGRIEMSESIQTGSVFKKQLICSFDEFSVNSYMNRILKTTMSLLLHSDISKTRKKELRKILVFFVDVEPLEIHLIDWKLQYARNNQSYRMLISICYLVVKGLLQTNSDGSTRLMDFLDEQRMCRLYEKFILEYYRKEFPQISVSSSQIPWALDDETSAMLPIMQSDVMLTYGDKVLILDAKYYSHATQTRYDARTLHSNNLYQIFAYVKNKHSELVGTSRVVSGMLLYAQTDDEAPLDHTYRMSGNKICVKTLDLNCEFSKIAEQLNKIASEQLGVVA